MAYRFDIFISMVFSESKIILAYVLWGAIFSTKDEVVYVQWDDILLHHQFLHCTIEPVFVSG